MTDLFNRKDYGLCLSAYLCWCYKNKAPELSYPAWNMPYVLSFSKPKTAKKYLLSAQVKVNCILRKYLLPVFEITSPASFSSPEALQFYLTKTKLHDLLNEGNCPEDLTPTKLLACVALVTELVLYCFKNECYRLADFLPLYLRGIVESKEFEDMFTDLKKVTMSSVRASEVFGVPLETESTVEEVHNFLSLVGYEKLNTYCKKLCDTKNQKHFEIFEEIGTAFRAQQIRKLEEASAPSTSGSSMKREEAKQEWKPCTFCGKVCHTYLKDFIDECIKQYGRCDTCVLKNCLCSFSFCSKLKKRERS